MKKILFPILATVLIAFAIMPLTAGTVFADEEDVYTVTVTPGTGTGDAFTVQSTTILSYSDMLAGHYDPQKGCFFRYDGENAVWYRIPDNPFTAPEGKEFDCWACILEESVERGVGVISMPASDNSIITALWKKSEASTTIAFSMSSSEIKYGEEENPFDILIKDSQPFAPKKAEIQLYNSSFTCISHDRTIPFTLTATNTAEWAGETVENGCRFTREQEQLTDLSTLNGKINIIKEAWAAAKPGTYIAIVKTELSVDGIFCESWEIPFVLVVLDKYSLWVGDTQVTRENAANITGSDPVQASYDADSNTLTLNNYTYEGHGCDNDDVKAAIKARMDDDFTINLIGDNTVKHVYKETSAGAGIYADHNMTITGDGTLTVSDGDNADNYNSRGIRVSNADLTIESGATVNASSGKGQNSIGVNVNNLTVQGELNAAGGSAKNSYGVYASNNVTVSKDGALNATGGTATKDSYGVFIYNKSPSMTIEGAMTARGNTLAIAKAADPNPSIDTAAIQISEDDLAEGYIAIESVNYDGSNATQVAAGGTTSATAKYVRIIGSAPVTGVSLNKTSMTLAVGDSETLTAVLKPEYALHPDLVWNSNDSNVATVSENGEVTAVAAGNATITVTATNGTEDTGDDKTATCDVTVKPMVKVTAPTGKTLTYNGKSQTGVAAGDNYTLTGATATESGSYTATATLIENSNYVYEWADGTTDPKTIDWKINKAVAKVTAPTGKTLTYNGSEQTGVAAGDNYTLTGATATNAGTYTAKATLKTNANYTYQWADGTTDPKTIEWKINKAVAKVTAPTGKTLTYNGSEQTGVAAGDNYTLTGATATNAGTYTAKATLKTNANYTYQWADGTTDPKTIEWKINKAVAKVTAPTGKTLTYNGKSQTGVAAGDNYTLTGTTKATKAGSYSAKATLIENSNYVYEWADGKTTAKTIKWKINKASNTFKIKARTATVKYSAVKNKSKVLGVTKVIAFTNKGQGTKTYVKKSGSKMITINKKNGKVTVKKGLKKGTYKVKVKVKAKGNANYKASAWKAVTLKILVK